jgi:predicted dehydrogenase
MNFLILGFGSVGSRHARNLTALGISCLIVEPKVNRLEEAKIEGYVSFKDLNEVSNDFNFDAVLVCSPPVFHIEQTIWALERNKKVFLEKPIGLNLNECTKLLQYDYSKVFVGYTYQWNPQFLKLKEDISNDLIGKTYYANFAIGMNLEDWHPWENYRDFFMSSNELGGGALLDESHFLELAIDLFGLPEKITSTQSKISSLEIETDDYVFAQFKYEKLLVDIKLDLFKRPHESFLQVYGNKGSINCDFIRKTNGLTTSISYANTISNSYEFEYEKNDVFTNMMEDFLRFVYSETILPRVTIPRGLEVMLIIDKIKEASLKQNWVTVGDQ